MNAWLYQNSSAIAANFSSAPFTRFVFNYLLLYLSSLMSPTPLLLDTIYFFLYRTTLGIGDVGVCGYRQVASSQSRADAAVTLALERRRDRVQYSCGAGLFTAVKIYIILGLEYIQVVGIVYAGAKGWLCVGVLCLVLVSRKNVLALLSGLSRISPLPSPSFFLPLFCT